MTATALDSVIFCDIFSTPQMTSTANPASITTSGPIFSCSSARMTTRFSCIPVQ